ncbi:hypothetical protein N0V93_008879 [Gnomoniopsis smithogilvyi]|uniref:Uncharacterized protein n=1 Tax=Gnomoniopsis smithogilvyi TaxID=1191159 RepID=A0A9W8YJS2_9PEZI|nr:hypothetical protein N0V93_008879 [Gnomoniopsis smithogilvyi]
MRCSALSTVLCLLCGINALKCGGHQSKASQIPQSNDFTLAIIVNSTYFSLSAVSNGTDLLVLQAGASPGTLTYTNQTTDPGTPGYNTSLVLNLVNSTAANYSAGYYGLSVPDLGEAYGATTSVVARKDYQEFEFQIDEDAIYHALTSASQSWFACLDSVNGNTQQSYFLKWGVFAAGGNMPVGCLVTNVVQVFGSADGATRSPRAVRGNLHHR